MTDRSEHSGAWEPPNGHLSNTGGQVYEFRLFVATNSPNSSRALANLRHVFEGVPDDAYRLEIIDITERPDLAAAARIVAIPTLVKDAPLPARWIIGDLSDRQRVAFELQIEWRA